MKPITVAVLACFLVLSIVPILAGCGSNPVATQNPGQSSQSNLTEKATGDEAAVEEVIKKFGAASDGTQNQEAASKFCTADGKVGLFSSPEGSFGEMIGFSNFQVSNSGGTNSCKINVTLTGGSMEGQEEFDLINDGSGWKIDNWHPADTNSNPDSQ